MTTILIKNGRVIDPINKLDGTFDVYIKDGKIQEVGKTLDKKYKQVDKTINAKNKVVCPGFVDIHVHLREPGREDKETIYTASRSAAKGGITSVIAMPNSIPPADNQTVLEYILSKAKKESLVNIFVAGAITKKLEHETLAEIWEMKNTGAVCVTDDGTHGLQNLDLYRKAMQYCKTHDMPMLSHTEDDDLSKDGQMHEGLISGKLGLKGIPASAEDTATARLICLVEEIKHQIHFTHVSTKLSASMIKEAKQRGLPITADVTPHHFSLTDESVDGFNTHAKVLPPLRSEDHRRALLKGLKDGTFSVIATDHAPHLWKEKETTFEEAAFGMVGFETMLPLIITNLVNKKVLTLNEAIAKITINPAKIMRLNKGTLSKGADADVCVFDPKEKVKVDRTKFESKGQNSPFHGMVLYGKVTDVVVMGQIVVKDSNIIK